MYFSEGVVAPAYYLLVCIFQKGLSPLHSIFSVVYFSEGFVSLAFYLFVCIFQKGLSPLYSIFSVVYFSEGFVSLAFYFLFVFFRRGCRPCITQHYLFDCEFLRRVDAPALRNAIFLFVFFRRVVAPALCSAIRQRSYDQITTSVRCQSQCSKSKGMYCSDSTSYFVQRLFLRRLFNTSFIVHGGNTDHTWRATVHGDHYITGIFQELG